MTDEKAKIKTIAQQIERDFDWMGYSVHNVHDVLIDGIEIGLEYQQKEIERLREALKYYADRLNWTTVGVDVGKDSYCIGFNVLDDLGKKAREALGEE